MNKYSENNRERIRKLKSEWFERFNPSIKKQLYELLGNKCCKCGFNDIRALQLDHILGDGYKERKNRKYYSYYVNNPLEAILKLQLLCANCNWIKRIKYKEFKQRGKND
jgi:hypothetical protein